MPYQSGDVILVPFPFSNLTATKVRPAIVVSSRLYHATEPDLIIAAVTSQLRAATSQLDYVLRDWQQAGLQRPSAFKPVVATLEPTHVIHHVGTLTAHDQHQIRQCLRLAFSL